MICTFVTFYWPTSSNVKVKHNVTDIAEKEREKKARRCEL